MQSSYGWLRVGFVCVAAAGAGAGAGSAAAEVQENDRIPVEIVQDIPCANGGAGEIVTLTGELHVIIKFQINGNVVRGSFHYQPDNVIGYGSVSGNRYEAVGVTSGSFRTTVRDGEAVVSTINNFRIVGQGPGNDFEVHENVRVALHPSGDFSVIVGHSGATCR